ncbi:MAG: hypothetical protein OHK0039_21590 [Bacteroidia bacterium]
MYRYLSVLLLSLLCLPALRAQQGADLRIEVAPGINPWTGLTFNNNPEHFQFAVVSDRTGGHRKGVFGDAVSKLNLLQPEFVMSVGDLIEGYITDTVELTRQWEEFDSLLRPLEMPFFYLPGNHDMSNETMRTLWEKRYGRHYYHFVYKDVLFICLNTSDGVGVTQSREQIDYVKQTLAANTDVRWTLLFMHHPIWGYNSGKSGFAEIEAALADREYTVFAGHTHNYLHGVRQDRNYYVLATTGGGSALRGPKFGEFDHVTWITMLDDGPRIVNLKLDGILRHNVVDSADHIRAQALVKAASFKHVLFSPQGTLDPDHAEAFTAQFVLANTGDRAMKFAGRFYHNHYYDVDQPVLEASIEPGASHTFVIRVLPQGDHLHDPDPLELDWSLGYPQPKFEPTFTLEGTYKFALQSHEEAVGFSDRTRFIDEQTVELNTLIGDARLVYTLDGSEPVATSPVYTQPLSLTATTTVKARLLMAGSLMSEVFSETYERVQPLAPVKVKKTKPGLAYSYYEGDFTMLPDFATLKPLKNGVATDFDVKALSMRLDHYAIRYEGYITVPTTEMYTFGTYSDDGSRLYIGGQLVVDNDGSHEARLRTGLIALQAGTHPIRIDYFDDFEGETLIIGYEAVGIEAGEIPFSMFSHK